MKRLNFLSKDDYYEVKFGSMLASYDRDILTMLYQPIIGYAGLALYFTLWSEAKRNDYSSLIKHEILINEMGIELTQLLEARLALEGIGLLKTYKLKLSKNTDSYIYEVFAPKSPEEFFNDVIYKGLLAKKIGTKQVEKLSMIFSSKSINVDAEDITQKFSDVYDVDENESLKVLTVKSRRGRKTINIKCDFEIGELLKELSTTENISSDAFTADDCNEIIRLATLFGFDVLTMKDVVFNAYIADAVNHLDYKKMYDLCIKYKDGINIKDNDYEIKEYTDDDKLSQQLNEMNRYSPFEYLKLKQGYTNPAPSDVQIINLLSTKYNFAPPVINVLIDYTLRMCDDSLPSAYIEKVAATLKRKNVETALAAINALKPKKKSKKQTDNHEQVDTKRDDVSVDDLIKMLEEY